MGSANSVAGGAAANTDFSRLEDGYKDAGGGKNKQRAKHVLENTIGLLSSLSSFSAPREYAHQKRALRQNAKLDFSVRSAAESAGNRREESFHLQKIAHYVDKGADHRAISSTLESSSGASNFNKIQTAMMQSVKFLAHNEPEWNGPNQAEYRRKALHAAMGAPDTAENRSRIKAYLDAGASLGDGLRKIARNPKFNNLLPIFTESSRIGLIASELPDLADSAWEHGNKRMLQALQKSGALNIDDMTKRGGRAFFFGGSAAASICKAKTPEEVGTRLEKLVEDFIQHENRNSNGLGDWQPTRRERGEIVTNLLQASMDRLANREEKEDQVSFSKLIPIFLAHGMSPNIKYGPPSELRKIGFESVPLSVHLHYLIGVALDNAALAKRFINEYGGSNPFWQSYNDGLAGTGRAGLAAQDRAFNELQSVLKTVIGTAGYVPPNSKPTAIADMDRMANQDMTTLLRTKRGV